MVADEAPEDILYEYIDPEAIKPQDLIIGETYMVDWEDCCVEGRYVGTFSGFQTDGDENWAVFDNRLYVRGSAKVRPLPEELT